MIKQFLKRSGIARYIIRRYRARTMLPTTRRLLGISARYWFESLKNGTKGKEILFATSAGGNLAAVGLETILAIALTLRGARVRVLLCDGVQPACFLSDIDWYRNEKRFATCGPAKSHCSDCFGLSAKLYTRLGIQVIKYSDYIDSSAIAVIEHTATTVPISDIPSFRDDGVQIGEHALAGALRFYARAELNDAFSKQILRRYFKAALIAAHVIRRVLDKETMDCVVVDHGIYVSNGVISAVVRSRNSRIVNWHVAYRKNCFLFSHHETYHHSLMTEPTAAWQDLQWGDELEKQISQYLHSRWYGTNDWISFNRSPEVERAAVEAELGIDLSQPTIGLLTNVMWDAQLHYPANAFKNMLEWVVTTIEYFRLRPDLMLVIRVHPAEVSGTMPSRQPIEGEIRRTFPILPPNIRIIGAASKISTYAVMQQCDTVLIYGTKTGVELTSMGIPTIVAGEAWIRNKGVTMDVSSKDEYLQYLGKLPLKRRLSPELVHRARKYAYHFFFRRMIPLKCVEPTGAAPPFRARIEDLSQLAPGADRGLDVICDGILNGAPFIFPAEKSADL